MKNQINFQYYKLVKSEKIGNEIIETPFKEFLDILRRIRGMDLKQRKWEREPGKVCYLYNLVEVSDNACVGTFSNVRHNFRPPVVDTTSLAERDNPRNINEGDKKLVYFAIKYNEENDDVTLMLQRNTVFNINIFRNYLHKFAREFYPQSNYSIQIDTIMSEDFDVMMRRMDRVSTIDVYYKKDIIGNNFTEFSENTAMIQDTIKLSVKAKRGLNMKEHIGPLRRSLSERKKIKYFVVKGKDSENHDIKINTSDLEYITSQNIDLIPDTGEYVYNDVIELMEENMSSFPF